MSYSNAVAVSSTVLGTIPSGSAAGRWYTVPLSSAAVQANVGRPLSMAIVTASADALILASRETADKPQLIVTY